MSPLFFISRSRSLSQYFSLSFAGLPPTFSCLIFQNCGHDNYSELNTLENTDTETISSFRLFRRLYFTRRRWLCDFPSKQPRVAFGLPYLFIELFNIGMPVVRTDGRVVGPCTVTWLPKFLGSVVYHIFLPWVLRFARESSAIKREIQQDTLQ